MRKHEEARGSTAVTFDDSKELIPQKIVLTLSTLSWAANRRAAQPRRAASSIDTIAAPCADLETAVACAAAAPHFEVPAVVAVRGRGRSFCVAAARTAEARGGGVGGGPASDGGEE